MQLPLWACTLLLTSYKRILGTMLGITYHYCKGYVGRFVGLTDGQQWHGRRGSAESRPITTRHRQIANRRPAMVKKEFELNDFQQICMHARSAPK